MRYWYAISVVLLTLGVAACDSGNHYAPVTDISAIEPIPQTGVHRVAHGETLYEIAWRYGLDYRELATRNHMTSPYVLYTGQTIVLRNTASQISSVSPVKAEAPLAIPPKPILREQAEPNQPVKAWQWPAQGKVVATALGKGINIEGSFGAPIYAAASGKVVYCGDGLRAYGKLIIIKHNNLYLSAYAHNSVIEVQEGEVIKQGQKIAEMGSTGTTKIMLHFEIRRAGKSVNPLSLLGKSATKKFSQV